MQNFAYITQKQYFKLIPRAGLELQTAEYVCAQSTVAERGIADINILYVANAKKESAALLPKITDDPLLLLTPLSL